jgi:hypothetical protein
MELELVSRYGRGLKLNYSSKRKDDGSQVRYATQLMYMKVGWKKDGTT